VALVFSGAALTALAAQVQIPMYPVPMTLQTFAVPKPHRLRLKI